MNNVLSIKSRGLFAQYVRKDKKSTVAKHQNENTVIFVGETMTYYYCKKCQCFYNSATLPECPDCGEPTP